MTKTELFHIDKLQCVIALGCVRKYIVSGILTVFDSIATDIEDVYTRRTKKLGIIDRYEAPQVVFTDLTFAEILPDIEFGHIYSS